MAISFAHNSCFGETNTFESFKYFIEEILQLAKKIFHSFKPVFKPTTAATTKPNKNLLLHNEQLNIAFVLHQSSFNRQCTEVIVHLRTNGFRPPLNQNRILDTQLRCDIWIRTQQNLIFNNI